MTQTISLTIDGVAVMVASGTSVAAALARCSLPAARLSVSGKPRLPFCGMGICQECRILIDGKRRLACQTLCRAGMQVEHDAQLRSGKHG
ncbi:MULTISPECIES: (2Fe-2S)-binding protein [Tenebrionibacter/Tenebrionicola group]|jgi:predicted molibdopterin-dependent oxidoreductase YjgC|uniref:(2Fe-2S)-binding protein n=2 Tax=Tenebrionibacter/Tenebrionicola group TaxID=2969848 RepID=A0A8K0V0Z5_9ENTR|nr:MULTISPECIES: (2Fe-2S)-binding protein [Tenebrionibacter/Tenebrionicola group]MBK4714893.1 (2Fe-2S)-binding protein [Tenebrionibacter intestinalis]MBV5095719.1 (2Fe-2S)-binding protein [Tenebrionicola larvae]